MNGIGNFLIHFLPLLGVYLGALGVVRYDIKQLKKKIEDLENQIKELKKKT